MEKISSVVNQNQGNSQLKLSVIIPAYNEKTTIEEIIRRVSEVDISKEIIAVDDGSTDGTTELLQKIEKSDSNHIKVVFLPDNRGKGAAVQAGLEHISGDIVIIQDADLELDPEEYPKLVEPILEGKAEVVYGSRFLKPVDGISFLSYAGNKVVTWATNLLYHTKLTDQATGYKVFNSDVIKNIWLESVRFEFCSEITAKVKRLGYDIIEIPVSYLPRSKKSGKKVRFRDGFKAIWTLLKYRFAQLESLRIKDREGYLDKKSQHAK